MTNMINAPILAALVTVVAWAQGAEAASIRGGFDANTLAANDDASAGPVSIGFDIDFLGVTTGQLFVNNNGNVTLTGPLSTFSPFELANSGVSIIAPFFADVDTRSAGSEVTYGTGTVDGRDAFGVNWVDVGFYSAQVNPQQLNDFQLVLIDRSDTGAGNFDIEFNYGDILWEAGDFSGGVNGLGGVAARAGFSNGTGAAGTFFELAGSGVNGAFVNGGANELVTGSNIDDAGRFLFTARNSSVDVQPSPVPLPAGAVLLLSGLSSVVILRRRRKR